MNRRRLLFFILRILIALFVLYFVIIKVSFLDIYYALVNPLRPGLIILSLFLLIPNLLLQWHRWHYLLKLIKPGIDYKNSFASLMGGMVVGFVTPGRLGEMGRPLFLMDIDRLQAAGMVFLDKFYSFITILVGGIWGLTFIIFYQFNYRSLILYPLLLISLIITVIGLLICIYPSGIRKMLYNISLIFPNRDKLKRFITCMDNFNNKQARIFLFLSFLMYGIYILQFCFLSLAFQRMHFSTAVSSTIATIFTKTLLPVSFADLGIREGAAVYFFVKFGIQKVTAFNSSILLFAINVLLPTCIGFLFLPRLGKNDRKSADKK
ncbi:MAG: lysylphosphatidylglycerol synthase transmembrane domain-containing protein [bacterium]